MLQNKVAFLRCVVDNFNFSYPFSICIHWKFFKTQSNWNFKAKNFARRLGNKFWQYCPLVKYKNILNYAINQFKNISLDSFFQNPSEFNKHRWLHLTHLNQLQHVYRSWEKSLKGVYSLFPTFTRKCTSSVFFFCGQEFPSLLPIKILRVLHFHFFFRWENHRKSEKVWTNCIINYLWKVNG